MKQIVAPRKGLVQSALMQDTSDTDNGPELNVLLYDIVNRMLEPYGKVILQQENVNLLRGPQIPFDISKPNQHDTKAEFQQEYDAVSASLVHVTGLIEILIPREDNEETVKTRDQIRSVIDAKARNHVRYLTLESSASLIRKNIADLGAYVPSMMVILDLKTTLKDRLQELESQKELFWNLPHRAPDYYARAVALRLAKLFAVQTGRRPTYGLSADTGEASTDYSRALKAVFSALSIKSQERGYAEWAVSQISDQDLRPADQGLLGSILGADFGVQSDSFSEMVGASPLSKPKQG